MRTPPIFGQIATKLRAVFISSCPTIAVNGYCSCFLFSIAIASGTLSLDACIPSLQASAWYSAAIASRSFTECSIAFASKVA